jgi:hypothetical protein
MDVPIGPELQMARSLPYGQLEFSCPPGITAVAKVESYLYALSCAGWSKDATQKVVVAYDFLELPHNLDGPIVRYWTLPRAATQSIPCTLTFKDSAGNGVSGLTLTAVSPNDGPGYTTDSLDFVGVTDNRGVVQVPVFALRNCGFIYGKGEQQWGKIFGKEFDTEHLKDLGVLMMRVTSFSKQNL